MIKYKYLLHVDYKTLIFKNMSSGPNGTQSAVQDEDEPKICKYTGQLIVEKQPKLFGLALMNMILISIFITASVVGATVLSVEDEKVKRQCLVQGIISIMCGVTYGLYL
jgi:hypothetical protein